MHFLIFYKKRNLKFPPSIWIKTAVVISGLYVAKVEGVKTPTAAREHVAKKAKRSYKKVYIYYEQKGIEETRK